MRTLAGLGLATHRALPGRAASSSGPLLLRTAQSTPVGGRATLPSVSALIGPPGQPLLDTSRVGLKPRAKTSLKLMAPSSLANIASCGKTEEEARRGEGGAGESRVGGGGGGFARWWSTVICSCIVSEKQCRTVGVASTKKAPSCARTNTCPCSCQHCVRLKSSPEPTWRGFPTRPGCRWPRWRAKRWSGAHLTRVTFLGGLAARLLELAQRVVARSVEHGVVASAGRREDLLREAHLGTQRGADASTGVHVCARRRRHTAQHSDRRRGSADLLRPAPCLSRAGSWPRREPT